MIAFASRTVHSHLQLTLGILVSHWGSGGAKGAGDTDHKKAKKRGEENCSVFYWMGRGEGGGGSKHHFSRAFVPILYYGKGCRDMILGQAFFFIAVA